jgi:hypothetical protein
MTLLGTALLNDSNPVPAGKITTISCSNSASEARRSTQSISGLPANERQANGRTPGAAATPPAAAFQG